MKKILLSLFLAVFVSSGAWADDYWLSEDTWYDQTPSLTEKVAKINLDVAGSLSAAITACKSTYPSSEYKKVYIDGNATLNDADIAALSALDYETIDLQDANYSSAFTFSNSTVVNLILPDGWTKAEVTTCAQAVGTQLGTALSQASYNGGAVGTAVNAYVNTGNTLYDAINRTFMDNKINTKLNTNPGVSQYNLKKAAVQCLSIAGNPVARDFSGKADGIYFDDNGHFVFNMEASEESYTPNTGVSGTRQLVGTRQDGAMEGAGLVMLDLEDAVIQEEYCNDITLSWTGVLSSSTTKYVIIPTCSSLKTIPADFIAGLNGISEICIPSNIENIKTRAFAASVDHIWTTAASDDIDNTTYDNGITDSEAEQVLDSDGNPLLGYTDVTFASGTYGTYTFSSNLKLIESFAFSNTEPFVSDVYVLAVDAPECHVDAFGIAFYVGYSGYGVAPDASGIISRGSFKNGNRWLTMLHYPRACTTPDIQRYTDPTREYSIATGLTDGKGAQIYFPMYGEFLLAYLQGTYGYTWKAWDTTRNSYGDIQNNPAIATNAGWTAAGQATANTLFTGDYPDATFYDTTLGNNTKPTALSNYYDVEWQGVQLYPQAETSTATDSEGNTIYEDQDVYQVCDNGTYVQNYSYAESTTGDYIKVGTATGTYTATTSPVDGVDTYYSDENGTVATPNVGSGWYYQDGEKNVYTAVDYNNDEIGAVEQYYKDENGQKVTTDLHFWNAMWYKTDETTSVTTCSELVSAWTTLTNLYSTATTNNVTSFYVLRDGVYTEGNPLLNTYVNYYIKDDSGILTQVTEAQSSETEYYDAYGNLQSYDNIQIAEAVYYNPVTTEQPVYASSSIYLSGKEWYTNEGDTEPVTLSWYSHISESQGTTLYYVSGTEPNYVSAEGSVYDSSKTYYSDANGTEAETITFDQTYYIADYEYSYADYDGVYEGTRYMRVYDGTYRAYDSSTDEGETLYCLNTIQVASQVVTTAYDYRGWHQFVLTGYAANTDVPMISYRSYMTDNDWWTICVPFDLNYNEARLFFGDPDLGKIPYVSQLLNVVRDQENSLITLNFSENLMLHKATYDGKGYWTVSATEAPSTATDAEDIVIHKGVPYLIRPYFESGRQFDIYPDLTGYENVNLDDISDGRIIATNDEYPGLYKKLKDAEDMTGDVQMEYQSEGIVTVPALVAEGSSEGTVPGKTVTYNDTEYPVSKEWDYSFVGAFYNNMIPANSYYLGYNSDKKKAMFYLATSGATSIYSAMKWINNTAVICPNMLSSSVDRTYNLGNGSHTGEVTAASGSGSSVQPAQWVITLSALDDLGTASGANGFGMNFGGNMSVNEETNGIEAQKVLVNVGGKVYTIDGRFVGESTNGLSKGVYIQNGKKVIVK